MHTPTFSELGVADPLRRALDSERYLTPTPVQARAIPLLLAGNNLLGIARTGTGKTAAFVLPLLQRLATDDERLRARAVRALILAPTRELAIQIRASVATYGRHLSLRHVAVYGGVSQSSQVKDLARGAHILVATPGRLLDLMGQGHVRLDGVRFLVLDEADRMLDMGFIRDVRKILAALPAERQSSLFSATMPPEVERLAGDVLRNPVRVEVSPETVTVDEIDQRVFFVDAKNKPALLTELLSDPAFTRVIVFTRTKHGANRLASRIEEAGVTVDAIHGNKSQSARQSALEGFRRGRTRVLVATDIAARGLDIDDVSHVINFELPNVPESYVHRIGRTARAGARGIALSFCDAAERPFLRDIEKLTRLPLAVVADHPGGGNRPDRAAKNSGGTAAQAGSPPRRRPRGTPKRRAA